MIVCKEHIELAIDDVLGDEELPIIEKLETEATCAYCDAVATYAVLGQSIRVEY